MNSVTSAISRATGRTSPAVLLRCTVSPSMATLMPSASGSGTRLRATMAGPIGQKPSRHLKRIEGR